MKKKKKNIFKIIAINIVAMMVVTVLLCFCVLGWLDRYTLHGQAVEVPSVCGLHIDKASKLLRNAKLDFEVVDYKYKKGAAENDVIEQQPLSGSKVKEGRRIQLTLNSAKEPLQALPDIIDNCSQREAVARLRAAGFNIVGSERIAGEYDWVYSVLMGNDTLKNGALVPMGSSLTLLIGNGEDIVEESEPIIEESWFE